MPIQYGQLAAHNDLMYIMLTLQQSLQRANSLSVTSSTNVSHLNCKSIVRTQGIWYYNGSFGVKHVSTYLSVNKIRRPTVQPPRQTLQDTLLWHARYACLPPSFTYLAASYCFGSYFHQATDFYRDDSMSSLKSCLGPERLVESVIWIVRTTKQIIIRLTNCFWFWFLFLQLLQCVVKRA